MPTKGKTRRGLCIPLAASWNPQENEGRIDDLLSEHLPDGVWRENKAILEQLGQLPPLTPTK